MNGWIVALSLCRALDAGSSIAVFRADGHEVMPWLPERPAFVISVHVGVTFTQARLLKHISREHPVRARWLAGVATGVECGIGAANLFQLRKIPK